MLKSHIEAGLTRGFGGPVEISELRRAEAWSLTPTLIASGVSIRRPDWNGTEIVKVSRARLKLAPLRALGGGSAISEAELDGLVLDLARDESGRKNWTRDLSPEEQAAKKRELRRSRSPGLARLVIRDARFTYDDAMAGRRAEGTIAANSVHGVVIEGEGVILGNPVRFRASGPPVVQETHRREWPFRAEIEGEALSMRFDGAMRTPLEIGAFIAQANARAADLALVDAVIEAGLPGTQPVDLKAKVTRLYPDWKIDALDGAIGRSHVSGEAAIVKRDGRTRIEGALFSRAFDFEDLSNAEGRRIAAEKRARFGPRLFPDTAIDLDEVETTDGKLAFRAETLLWPGPSPFSSVQGLLSVDRSRLEISSLIVGLKNGEMTGGFIVDQRKGGPVLSLALNLSGARLEDFFAGDGLSAPFEGRLALAGPGRTFREAIGASDGRIALHAGEGEMPARAAALLGQDVGRGLTTGSGDAAALHCLVLSLDVRDGRAAASPFVIDTSLARADAEGTLNLADETLDLSLSGAPKRNSLLRFEGRAPIRGTIKAPDIGLPDKANSVGEIIKSVGEAIIGDRDPIAEDADCTALKAQSFAFSATPAR